MSSMKRMIALAAVVLAGVFSLGALAGCSSSGSGGSSSASGATASVPSDFPTSVPVVDGQILRGDFAASTWNVQVQVPDAAGQQGALKKLQDAGFTIVGTTGSSAADRVYSLANQSYSVRMSFSVKDSNHIVSYGVSARPAPGASQQP